MQPLWVILALWFLWFIGEGLERAWGPFQADPLLFYRDDRHNDRRIFLRSQFSNGMLIASLFFAFARFYPDEVIYVLFILPVKIKWLAWVFAAFLSIGFVLDLEFSRAALVAAFANYFIFFGPEILHHARHRHDVSTRRRRFECSRAAADDALHRCAVCGATEQTDPSLDFRVARDGEEYCMAHLPKAAAPG